jgi:hypothetical protein
MFGIETMIKTNFDLYLEENLKDPEFAARYAEAGKAWHIAMQRPTCDDVRAEGPTGVQGQLILVTILSTISPSRTMQRRDTCCLLAGRCMNIKAIIDGASELPALGTCILRASESRKRKNGAWAPPAHLSLCCL